jgi:hypothetical protein
MAWGISLFRERTVELQRNICDISSFREASLLQSFIHLNIVFEDVGQKLGKTDAFLLCPA